MPQKTLGINCPPDDCVRTFFGMETLCELIASIHILFQGPSDIVDNFLQKFLNDFVKFLFCIVFFFLV